MAKLLGFETEGTGTTITVGNGRAYAFKVTAEAGTAEEFHITFASNGSGTSVDLAIQQDESGKPKNGVLPESEKVLTGSLKEATTKGTHVIAISPGVALEATTYWLTVSPQGGTCTMKPQSPATTGARKTKSSPTAAKISEIVASSWEPEETLGPVAFWVTGTAGGESEPKLKAIATKSVSTLNTPKLVVTEASVTLHPVAITETSGLAEDQLGGQTVLIAVGIASTSSLRRASLSEPGGGGRTPFAELMTVGRHSKFRSRT